MMRDGFGLTLHNFREAVLDDVRNHGMQPCASALEKSRIGRIPYERVLEGIDRPGDLTSAEYQLRSNQLRQWVLESLSGQPGNEAQELIGELATYDRPDLSHLPHRRQSIQPCHERRMQCRRNCHQ